MNNPQLGVTIYKYTILSWVTVSEYSVNSGPVEDLSNWWGQKKNQVWFFLCPISVFWMDFTFCFRRTCIFLPYFEGDTPPHHFFFTFRRPFVRPSQPAKHQLTFWQHNGMLWSVLVKTLHSTDIFKWILMWNF